MIIAIDGNHGVGKSTLINHLKEYYIDNNNVVFIKYPSYTDIGILAKSKVGIENNDIVSLLFAADLTNCYYKNIIFESQKIYILDRYVLSLFTFQGEVNNENYNFLHNITSRIKYPDIQIIIHKKDDNINTDLDPFVIMARKMNVDGLITNIFIVENTFGTRDNPNLTAFEKIRLIIDNAIKEYIE